MAAAADADDEEEQAQNENEEKQVCYHLSAHSYVISLTSITRTVVRLTRCSSRAVGLWHALRYSVVAGLHTRLLPPLQAQNGMRYNRPIPSCAETAL